MDIKKAIEEDLKLQVGLGATTYNGRDAHPYYISELLPNGVVGLYEAHWKFDDKHPWEGGDGVVDAFDPSHKTAFYIKRRYNEWWRCEKDGKPISKFTNKWKELSFNGAFAYQDPNF